MTSPSTTQRARAPLSDAIIVAVASLIDDAGATREPSHSDLEFQVTRAGLSAADPRSQGQTVGKAKRVRAILSWAIEHNPDEGEIFVAALIATIRGKGGFRPGSPNYVGQDAVTEAIAAFREEGFALTAEGELLPTSLDNLAGTQLTAALAAYVRRARRGSADAALLVGTGKDLLEATAAHVLTERYGQYSDQANFPTLLGQAFTALGLATPQSPISTPEPPQRRLQRAMYEAGCAVNALRNRQGTGHGRPWVSSVTDVEARSSVQLIGIVAEFLLAAHRSQP